MRLPYLRGTGLHCTNGLPDVPCGQLHIGMWFTTSHVAPWPHVPGQGSAHLFRIQALSLEQSVLSTHSGRQPEYGSPWYSGRQVQPPSRHWAFGPQGDGLHGSDCTGSAAEIPTKHDDRIHRGLTGYDNQLLPSSAIPMFMSLSLMACGSEWKHLRVSITVYVNGKSGVNAMMHQPLYSLYKLNGSCLRGGGFGKQLVKGSPVYPSGQVHTGVW